MYNTTTFTEYLSLKYGYIIETISLKCLNVLNISKMIKTIKAKWFQQSYQGAIVQYSDDLTIEYEMIQKCLFWHETKAFTLHIQDIEDIPG